MPYTGQIVIKPSCSHEIYEAAQFLCSYIADYTGFAYEIKCGSSQGTFILEINDSLGAEHYSLDIENGHITITGGDKQGLRYGIQTIRQMLMQQGAVLPCLHIEDFPAMLNRGYFHDVSRGRVPTLSWLKSLADTLACYKMNQLQLYVEHSFLFSGLSEVTRDDTPLVAEEIMELDDYCSKRGIELIPALASFGHLYKVLSTKSFHHLCELSDVQQQPFSFQDRMAHHTIDISNEESFSLIKRLILEMMPLFKSKKFNICADETFDLGKGKNKERWEKEGTAGLYMEFIGKLCDFIASEGHIPMLWGDIMLAFPELLKQLPEETICLNWGYNKDQTEESTRIYANVGAKQYVCPGVGGWNQLINLHEAPYQNITKMCGYGMKYGAIGMFNTDWGDYGHINHPPFSIPGLIYGAWASWNRKVPSYEEMNRQISLVEYQDASQQLLLVTGELCEQSSFTWDDVVRFKELHDANTDEEEYRTFILMKADRLTTADTKKITIEACKRSLSECIAAMDSETRGRVKPYLLAADGLEILNEIGEILFLSFNGKQLSKKAWRLAKELEMWYYQYRLLWYEVSKESELYRISEVIFWYADYLRELQ